MFCVCHCSTTKKCLMSISYYLTPAFSSFSNLRFSAYQASQSSLVLSQVPAATSSAAGAVSTTMPKSALVGYPPVTDQDYWIAKYMIRTLGIKHGDPSQGFKVNPPRPPAGEYQFETRGPGLIAGLSICVVVMAGVTGLRLYLRLFSPRLKTGLDDWLLIPGIVCILCVE